MIQVIHIHGQHMIPAGKTCKIVDGAANYNEIMLIFDNSEPKWLTAKKYVSFGSGKFFSEPVLIPSTGVVTVPAEYINPPELYVYVGGYDASGDILITTDGCQLPVAPSGAQEQNPAPMPPDFYSTMRDYCDAAVKRAENAAVHAPMIGDNLCWWVWDAEKEAYVDTGVIASPVSGITDVATNQDIDNMVDSIFGSSR